MPKNPGKEGRARAGILVAQRGTRHILGAGLVGRRYRKVLEKGKSESDTRGRSLRENVLCRGPAYVDGPRPKVALGQGLL